MLYVLSSALSGAGDAGEGFLDAVTGRVSVFHPTSRLSNAAAVGFANPGPDDGVAFVIGDDPSAEGLEFLRLAAAAGSIVLPIALDAEGRRPPAVVAAAQSFDVLDALRRADHAPERLDVAARVFARAVLARLAPTCFRKRLRVFLSYRREDGEGLTAQLDKALSARHEHVFRDLVDIQVGEPAQDVIDQHLLDADVVVFIDTPRAGESSWVAQELASAMGHGIPIVWTRIGPLDGRAPLPVAPGESPQVDASAADSLSMAEFAEAVLDAALDQVQEAIRASTSAFATVRRWAEEHGGTIAALDQRRLIYAVSIPGAPRGRYPKRPHRDIIQLFGRSPNDEDIDDLRQWLGANGYTGHPVECRAFDAAILVRPTPGRPTTIDDWAVVDAGDQYAVQLIGASDQPGPGPRSTLLLLGAFPADPRAHPGVMAAVSALSRSWLARGGRVTFGGHPTLTPLVSEAARLVLAADARERVIIFRSEFFSEPGIEFGVGEAVVTRRVPAAVDLNASLTALREQMIQEGGADIAVIVGGRTTEDGTHKPGVEEELDLARRVNIPVVVLASPGGQAAVIAERERQTDPPWAGLGNGLTDELNRRIADDDDYAAVAGLLWEMLRSRQA